MDHQQRAPEPYLQRLATYAKTTAQSDSFYSLTFGVLHRLNITHLHNELAQIKTKLYQQNVRGDDIDLGHLRDTLQAYGIASIIPLKYTSFS
jgi:hypothetical protein